MAMSAAPASGRVIVFHGAPGTGKTTAARALLSAWSSWAHLFLVVDADQLFGDPGYLVGLVAQLRHQREQRPALIVAEDCNDQLTGTTGGTSPTLGRLLNVADGIFGQSTSVIILMTTNAEMTRLHPAITRPGRCLAAVEFERHSPSEAAGLLGRHPPGPLTLAEVLAERGDLPAASRAPSHGSGGYL
jgi:ATP-dependent 26S proteasome regulatory subunit